MTGPMLSLNNIEVIYDGVILVLKGVSIEVREGGITTLLGANGAGKTTTLKAVSGLLRTERGDITKGTIELGGPAHRPPRPIRGRQARRRAGLRGAPGVRAPDHRGELDRGRPHPVGRQPRGREHRARLSVLPAAQGAARCPGRLSLGRRAADARHRARADVDAPGHPARRALARSRAHARRGDLRDRAAAQPRAEADGAAGRAERGAGARPSPTTAT